MYNKVVLITGATAGIGKKMATNLAEMGCHVIIAARNPSKATKVLEEIKTKVKFPNVEMMRMDLADFDSIRRFSEEFHARNLPIHVLINNAGMMSIGKKQMTRDGYELHWQSNYMGHYLLTRLLEDILISSAPARVISISSCIHTSGHKNFFDVNFEHSKYGMFAAYSKSKFAQILFTYALHRRLEKHGVMCTTCHPGIIYSDIFKQFLPRWLGCWLWPLCSPIMWCFMKSVSRGAKAGTRLASSDEYASVGGFYANSSGDRAKSSPESYNIDLQEALWKQTAQLFHLPEEITPPENPRVVVTEDRLAF